MKSLRKQLIDSLVAIRKERNKRDEIFEEFGIHFSYFHDFSEEALISLISYNIFLMNKKVKRTEKEIKDFVIFWLDHSQGICEDVGKKRYSIDTAKDLITFLLENKTKKVGILEETK